MLSRNSAPQKKDRFRSRFIVAVNLLHHLATSASGCSSIKKRLPSQSSFFGRSSRNRTYTIGVRGLCAATTPCSIGETFFKFVKNIAQDNI